MSGSLVVLERGARDSNGYRWIKLRSRLRFLYFHYSSTSSKIHDVIFPATGDSEASDSSIFIALDDASTEPGPALPYQVHQHCVIKLSDTLILMTGGTYWQQSSIFSSTYYHDFITGVWTQGPSLVEARRDHACAAFGSGIPIVARGYNSFGYLASVELLTSGKYKFRI